MNLSEYNNIIWDFKIYGNNYHILDNNIQHTIVAYKKNIEAFNRLIDYVPTLIPKDKIRIMSYNVRFFTALDNKPTIEYIMATILKYTPHVVCLQEFSLGQNKYYNTKDLEKKFTMHLNKLLDKYTIISVCVYPPAFYTSIYGNVILIHKNFINNIKNLNSDNNPEYRQFVKNLLCNDTIPTQNKCYMNQMIFNYDNIPKIKHVKYDTTILGQVNYREQTNENKCFIKITLPCFDLICVHLDATYIEYRIQQLKQINDVITRSTIIIGDFNFFDLNDFLDVINNIYGIYVITPIAASSDEKIHPIYYEKIINAHKKLIQAIIKKNNEPIYQFIKKIVPLDIIESNNIDRITNNLLSNLPQTTNMNILLNLLNVSLTIDDIKVFENDKTKIPNDNKIKQILFKFFSLEDYFKDRSGSILDNKEINYCIDTLKWNKINSLDTINLSQWSGTRVDMAFFAKFPQDIIYDHYLLPIDINKGSDHLPLILDFKLDDDTLIQILDIFKLQETLPIMTSVQSALIPTHINSTKSTQSISMKQVSNIIKGVGECEGMPTLFKINAKTFDFPLYNCQPCTIESFDWYIDGEFTRINDPYILAGTTSNMLGRKGVYVSAFKDYVIDVVKRIKEGNLKSLQSNTSGIFYSYFMFTFKYIGPIFDNIVIATGEQYNDILYETCYDNYADILVDQPNNPDYICKITPKNVQAYLTLSELSVNCNITTDYLPTIPINNSEYVINEKLLQELENANKFALIFNVKNDIYNKLKLAYIVIINTIDYINKISMEKYKKQFIKKIDEERFKIYTITGEMVLSYNIDLSEYSAKQSGGKSIMHHKYNQKKCDYIFLKSV